MLGGGYLGSRFLGQSFSQIALSRTASDAAAGTDTVASAGKHPRVGADAGAGTDVLTRGALIQTRAITDTAAGTDTTARLTTAARTSSDTGSGTDVATGTSNVPHNGVDTAAGTDAATTGTYSPNRTTFDLGGGDDSVAITGLRLARPGIVNPAEPEAGVTAPLQSQTTPGAEPVTVNPTQLSGTTSPQGRWTWNRTTLDSAGGDDALTTVFTPAPSRNDRSSSDVASGIDEADGHTPNVYSATSDTGGGQDSVTAARGEITRSGSDTASGMDTASGHAPNLYPATSDRALGNDSVSSTLGNPTRGANDVASGVDAAVGHAPHRYATTADTANGNDAATFTRSLSTRNASDTAVGTDAITIHLRHQYMTAGDAAGGSDAATQVTRLVQHIVRNALDAAGGIDVAGRMVAMFRASGDVGAGADRIGALGVTRAIADLANGADSTTRKVKNKARTTADTGNGTDALARKVTTARGPLDAAGGTDVGTSSFNGLGISVSVTSTVNAALLASPDIDFIALTIPWELLDPTNSSGGRVGYQYNGNNSGFGSSAASGGSNLKLLTNLRAIGAAGKKALLCVRTGNRIPKWLVGEPNNWTGGDFQPVGLAGTMAAGVVRQQFSEQNGANTVSVYNAPKMWGTDGTTYLTALTNFANALAAELASQFVTGSSGQTLLDVVAAVDVLAGMNRGTHEVRLPEVWPAVIAGSTHGLGTPDNTTPGISTAPEQFGLNGYTPAAIETMAVSIRQAWQAAFPTKTLALTGIIPTGISGAFPQINANGNWPVGGIDLAATLTASGKTTTNATIICLDANSFPTGRSMADIPDPVALGQPQTMFMPRSGGGGNFLDLITYTSIDIPTRQLRGCSGGASGHQLLGAIGITGKTTASFGGVQLNTATSALSTAGWVDGQLVMIHGVVSSNGLDTALNGKVFTARGLSGAPVSAITLTNPDGTPAVSAGTWLSGGFIVPLAAAGLTDGSTNPCDPQMSAIVTAAAAALGNQLLARHDNITTGGGTLTVDQPFLGFVAALPYDAQLGGQLDQATFGTQGTTADNTTTSSQSPSFGTGTTFTIPLTAAIGPASGSFMACVNGTDVTVTAGQDTTSWTVSPAVAFPAGARVTWSPSYLPTVTNAESEDLLYVEGFPFVNLDSDTHSARELLRQN